MTRPGRLPGAARAAAEPPDRALPDLALAPVAGIALSLAGLLIAFSARYGYHRDTYSGDNGFWYWGPPPSGATIAVAVGFDRGQLAPFCGRLRLAAHLDNHVDVQDDEQGAPVWVLLVAPCPVDRDLAAPAPPGLAGDLARAPACAATRSVTGW